MHNSPVEPNSENPPSCFLINCSYEKCNSLAFNSVWLILLLSVFLSEKIIALSLFPPLIKPWDLKLRTSSMVMAILLGSTSFSLIFRGLGGDELIANILIETYVYCKYVLVNKRNLV